MTDALVTPWTGSPLAAPPAPLPLSLAPLAAPPAGSRAGRWTGGDALSCPWSTSTLPVPALPVVRALPCLAPDVPVQRTAGDAPVLV